MRYYYKDDKGNYYNLKHERTDLIPISKDEFDEFTKPKEPTEQELEIIELQNELAQIEARFKELDYIGIKIATGRATVEDYAEEVAEMDALAIRKNEIKAQLN